MFTLPETNSLALKMDATGIRGRFLLGPGLLSGANWLLVSGRGKRLKIEVVGFSW